VLLSAGVVWNCICMLLFCIVIIHGVEYMSLEIKQYFDHLFILLVTAINMEVFQGCSYVYLFGLSVLFPLCSVCFCSSVLCLV
jgi:hypothetical protein